MHTEQVIGRRALLGGAAASVVTIGAMPARAGGLQVTQLAGELDEPWSVAILRDGRFLVAERGGSVWLFEAGARYAVSGVPSVAVQGQGGLLDVVAARDFAQSRALFITFARAQQRSGAGTALAVARLSDDARRLEDLAVIYEAPAGGRGGRHFGSRVVELPDGTLALTIGDRGDDARAQDLERPEGKVMRVARDGSVPGDNPFRARAGTLPEIWSYGHRNPQGAALDANGQLWVSEHGARGGDEINAIVPGANYGWPIISYGRHYSGAKIGIGTEAPGMEQPAHYWDPSIAPSGHVICSGRMFPEWRGHHLVGSLNSDHIARLDPSRSGPGGWAQERIELPETLRVRDVREAPDGSIWFLSVNRGGLFRLARG